MEQTSPNPAPTPPPAPEQPAATPPPAPEQPIQTPPNAQPQPAAPAQNKSNAWAWILGGCLTIVILVILGVFILGWWGMKQAKKELEKSGLPQSLEQIEKEGREWEKKSKEFRDSIPSSASDLAPVDDSGAPMEDQ